MAPEVTLTQMIDGPVEAVFRAWTDPHTLVRWWGPPGFSTRITALDVRPGGTYGFVMSFPDGDVELRVGGEYRAVDPPHRLVFSWRWEDGVPDGIESLVTVQFHPLGRRTGFVLTHSGFHEEDAVRPYADGWNGSLPALVALFGAGTST